MNNVIILKLDLSSGKQTLLYLAANTPIQKTYLPELHSHHNIISKNV